MNLFDYIKFQSIDITNMEELAELPEEILYRVLCQAATRQAIPARAGVEFYCLLMPMYCTESISKRYFQEALTEYYRTHNTDHEPI